MATYGIEVLTGLSETRLDGSSRTLRTVYWDKLDDGTSGSVTVNDFSENKGFISVAPLQGGESVGGVLPIDFTIDWDEGSKTMSWDLTSDNNSFSLIVSLMMYG